MAVCHAKFEALPDSESPESPAHLGNRLNAACLTVLQMNTVPGEGHRVEMNFTLVKAISYKQHLSDRTVRMCFRRFRLRENRLSVWLICGELQGKLEMRDEMPSYIVNAVVVKGRHLAWYGKYFNMASYIYIFCHFYRI